MKLARARRLAVSGMDLPARTMVSKRKASVAEAFSVFGVTAVICPESFVPAEIFASPRRGTSCWMWAEIRRPGLAFLEEKERSREMGRMVPAGIAGDCWAGETLGKNTDVKSKRGTAKRVEVVVEGAGMANTSDEKWAPLRRAAKVGAGRDQVG